MECPLPLNRTGSCDSPSPMNASSTCLDDGGLQERHRPIAPGLVRESRASGRLSVCSACPETPGYPESSGSCSCAQILGNDHWSVVCKTARGGSRSPEVCFREHHARTARGNSRPACRLPHLPLGVCVFIPGRKVIPHKAASIGDLPRPRALRRVSGVSRKPARYIHTIVLY